MCFDTGGNGRELVSMLVTAAVRLRTPSAAKTMAAPTKRGKQSGVGCAFCGVRVHRDEMTLARKGETSCPCREKPFKTTESLRHHLRRSEACRARKEKANGAESSCSCKVLTCCSVRVL